MGSWKGCPRLRNEYWFSFNGGSIWYKEWFGLLAMVLKRPASAVPANCSTVQTWLESCHRCALRNNPFIRPMSSRNNCPNQTADVRDRLHWLLLQQRVEYKRSVSWSTSASIKQPHHNYLAEIIITVIIIIITVNLYSAFFYGRPLSVSGRPCYVLPMFLFIYLFLMAALFSGHG